MTDYTHATGSTGTMMIRDTGTTVEFWLKAGSSTFDHEMPWRYYFNGAWSSYRNFDFQSGGAYQKLGSVTVTTDQTVGFEIGATGTGGLGGPTQFTISVDRTSAPGTPGAWVIEQIEDVQVQGDTDTMPNGGLAIDQVQVRYDDNTAASSPSYLDPGLDAWGWATGLSRGKTYYFWVRTHNAKGWSPWSARTQATTQNFPAAPTAATFSNVTQTSAKTSFASNGDGGSTILEWQVGYSKTSSTTPDTYQSGWAATLSNLSAGSTYYVWVRARNKWGWGAWSARSTLTLVAGAHVNVNGVWKRAVPFVNVNGVWKTAEVWAKIAGTWKETG